MLRIGGHGSLAACGLAAALLCAGMERARADSGGARLVAPTQGRPVFVAPGEAFTATVQLSRAWQVPRVELVARGLPAHRLPLNAEVMAQASGGRHVQYTLTVPAEAPEATYDLKITTPTDVLTARHAVAVAHLGRRIRLVHLSNMNVGDVGAPEFDRELIREINHFGPTLIVATGDYLDATYGRDPEGWEKLADFLAEFDAPALAACGDHDDVGLYSDSLAPSPIGAIKVGVYEGLVLYDLPSRPISHDPVQIQWVEGLAGKTDVRLRFVVSHDDCPNLLAYWQERGTLREMTRACRIGLWFSGGHRDWMGREYRAIIEAADPLLYLRTHQSSPAPREGADGVSHFRVVDLEDDRAMLYGPMTATGTPGSIAVGRLKVTYDGPNDGSRPRVALSAVSALPFRVDHLGARVLLKKEGNTRPWCHGARLAQLTDFGTMWACQVQFDLPDKGALSAVVGVGDEPLEPVVDVQFDAPQRLVLRAETTPDGVQYYGARDWAGYVHLAYLGTQTTEVTPFVRLDGQVVPYQVVGAEGPVASAYRLRLAPRQTLSLQLDLSAVRVSPGRRELQVYLSGGTARTPACWPMEVAVEGGGVP